MKIKLYTDNIKENDKPLAISVRNYIKNGFFVIGNPALGLKKTLKELEAKLTNKDVDVTDWSLKDGKLIAQIMMTKAGIEGETNLCSYLSRLLKHDSRLTGIIAFASLSYEPDEEKEYIPDTDVILVFARHIMIIDAKNIKTRSNQTYSLIDNVIYDSNGKEIIHVHSSEHIWRNVMKNAEIEVDSFTSYVCIVNETETDIEKSDDKMKLIHVADLKTILYDWIENKNKAIHLDILTEIAKAQIREEKITGLDLDAIKKKFNI